MTSWFLWRPGELAFESARQYKNPYLDVDMYLLLRSPDGQVVKVPAFWDGDMTWKVRVAPWQTGMWQWESCCSDQHNTGLAGKSGNFLVTAPETPNPIYRYGFIKIHDSRRAFAHADNTPFFWLGDTAWSVSANATHKEWREYLQTRSRQGYTIAQLNSLPQWDASVCEYRQPFAITNGSYDFTSPNPAYFRYLDGLVAAANESGILAAMVVLWFNYVAGANKTWDVERFPIPEDLAYRYGRYLASRYAAFGTLWLISGDTDYNAPQTEATYDKAALGVLEGSYCPPLMTAHLNGGLFTPERLNNKPWLGFHMFQSCHVASSATKALEYTEKDRNYRPIRPVLNGEPCYDHIRYLGGDNPENKTVERDFVRQVAWTSILGGANAGLTYGAHGLWPWHRRGEMYRQAQYGLPLTWQEALRLDSGDDMTRLVRFVTNLFWWELVPESEAIQADKNTEIIAAKTSDGTLVAYLSDPAGVTITVPNGATDYRAVWYDPKTGLEVGAPLEKSEGKTHISSPDWSGDCVLLVTP